jgi:hypothetical protein
MIFNLYKFLVYEAQHHFIFSNNRGARLEVIEKIIFYKPTIKDKIIGLIPYFLTVGITLFMVTLFVRIGWI